MLRNTLYQTLIELTNGPLTSRMLRAFTMSKWSRYLIPLYMKTYHIQANELIKRPREFTSLHAFFIRELKEGTRIIEEREDAIISPVDGVIVDWGIVTKELEIVIKGKSYSVTEMLGDQTIADKYDGGTFFLLYLSPADYHRIHVPLGGNVLSRQVFGRKSYPVNRIGLRYGRSPLAKNFRMVSEIDTMHGTYAVVKVGAMYVNSIEWTAGKDQLHKGAEMGYFSFGSSVVLLFPEKMLTINASLQKGNAVKVGECLARME